MIINKMSFVPSGTPLMSLINEIKNIDKGGLDLQPSYQRGYIWKKDYQEKLIYSLFNSYPIGSIVIRLLNGYNSKGAKREVVDGQQRLTTINNFVNDKIILDSDISKKIIEVSLDYFEEESLSNKRILKILNNYKNNKNIKLKFSDFPESLKGNIWAINIATIQISNSTEDQVSEYFRFVQNQERLRAGEIINSVPETVLEKYLDQITNKELLLKNISFKDDRKEFEKIFYGMIGLFEKKINLGSTDKIIMEYVSNKTIDLSGEALDFTNNMIKNLNKIITSGYKSALPSNKRLLKLLLLLCGFNKISFDGPENITINLNYLTNLNTKLSAFNSALKKALENTFGSIENANRYRGFSLIVKGAHNFKKVSEEIIKLSEIIKHESNNIL